MVVYSSKRSGLGVVGSGQERFEAFEKALCHVRRMIDARLRGPFCFAVFRGETNPELGFRFPFHPPAGDVSFCQIGIKRCVACVNVSLTAWSRTFRSWAQNRIAVDCTPKAANAGAGP